MIIRNKQTGQQFEVNSPEDAQYFGINLPDGAITPQTETIQPRKDLLSGIPSMALGTAGNVMKDIVQGITSRGTLGTADKMGEQASQLEKKAMQTQDMEQRKSLLRQANQYRSGQGQIAQQTASQFSPEVEKGTLGRSLGAATQIATTAEVLANPMAIVKGIKDVGQGILHPLQTLGKLRESILANSPQASIATKDFENEVFQRLKDSKFYQQAPEATKKEAVAQLQKFLLNVNPMKTMGAPGEQALSQPAMTLLNKVYENIAPFEKMAKAYTKGGDMGSTALAQGANLVSHAVRAFAKEQSPWKAKALTSLMQAGYTVGGNWKPILKALGIGAAGIGGYETVKALTKQGQ